MILFIVVWAFAALFAWGKIVGYLDWSWWLVFLPVWLYLTLIVLSLLTLMFIAYMEKKK